MKTDLEEEKEIIKKNKLEKLKKLKAKKEQNIISQPVQPIKTTENA